MSYTEPLLDVSRLSKSFGTHRVLDQVTFRLPPGLHALLGPNGAGKTTLVNILSTLIRADAGRVRVLGLDPQADQRRLRSLISVTGQYAAVDQRLTGTENMLMMGQLFGLSRAETRRRGGRLLERFDLTTAAARPVSTYSGGMRRKLDLALCLIAAPQLIFLDEPTTGLDTRSRLALWDEITALARAGTSIFLTTQYLEEAEALADRILVLHDGGIVAEGTAVELKERLGAATLEDVFLALTETSATDTGAMPNTTTAEKTSEKVGSAA